MEIFSRNLVGAQDLALVEKYMRYIEKMQKENLPYYSYLKFTDFALEEQRRKAKRKAFFKSLDCDFINPSKQEKNSMYVFDRDYIELPIEIEFQEEIIKPRIPGLITKKQKQNRLKSKRAKKQRKINTKKYTK